MLYFCKDCVTTLKTAKFMGVVPCRKGTPPPRSVSFPFPQQNCISSTPLFSVFLCPVVSFLFILHSIWSLPLFPLLREIVFPPPFILHSQLPLPLLHLALCPLYFIDFFPLPSDGSSSSTPQLLISFAFCFQSFSPVTLHRRIKRK